jgi:hypothetical protein
MNSIHIQKLSRFDIGESSHYDAHEIALDEERDAENDPLPDRRRWQPCEDQLGRSADRHDQHAHRGADDQVHRAPSPRSERAHDDTEADGDEERSAASHQGEGLGKPLRVHPVSLP